MSAFEKHYTVKELAALRLRDNYSAGVEGAAVVRAAVSPGSQPPSALPVEVH